MLKTLTVCSSLIALSTAAAFGLSVAHGHYMSVTKPTVAVTAPEAATSFAAPRHVPVQPRPVAVVAAPVPTAVPTLSFPGLAMGSGVDALFAPGTAQNVTAPDLKDAKPAPAVAEARFDTKIETLTASEPFVLSAMSTQTALGADALAPRYLVGVYR